MYCITEAATLSAEQPPSDQAVHHTFQASIIVQIIEEGKAASKSPHSKFRYIISISQQADSADITKNSAVAIFK
jgi:hypothetical protein